MELSYCTNVHPAEDLDGVLAQLDAFAGPVRRAAGLAELGVGLWLPADLAARLAGSAADRQRLRDRLDANALVLRTINAFPYRAFHADVVKLDVYRPDWTDPRRTQYTLDCAAVLADLLPDGAAGSISTLPLGWREPWTADDDQAATEALALVSRELRALRDRTGRTIRIAIEPEPGCVLDTVADVVGWLEPRLSAEGTEDIDRIDPEFVGVCLDTCHLAVSFADPVAAVQQIGAAGLRVVKVQASAALHVEHPADPASRDAVAAFVEPRYLHQTRALRPGGSVAAADDLPEALETLPTDGPWRVHFHVPLHLAPRAPITATTEVLTAALAAVRELPHGDEAHLDVETYTWTVLPDPVDDLVTGIAGELRWAAEHLLGNPTRTGARDIRARRTRARGGARMTSTLLLDVVGLTPRTLAHMPRLQALATSGAQTRLGTVLPAVTCSVQSTMLTGLAPAQHGIVGNGWYFRDQGEVHLWRQHNALVHGEKVWETARRARPGFTAANIGWWYAMGASTDITVTPRPIYHADGRKSPDAYVRPPALHDQLTDALGEFPLFQYWGPTASITSSRWIIEATRTIIREHRSDLVMAYLPHLDYDLQRFGPDSPAADRAAADLDHALAPLLDDAASAGVTVIAVAEYGIEPANQPVDINRALRRAGLLEVYTQQGREQLDPWTSRAFAVADHQVAHVYVTDPADLNRTREVLEALPGVDEVLDREQQTRYGLDHERSGELVVIAEPGAWFTYYYWLDDDHAPEFARGVDIHRKPGYDPAELFLNPADRLAKAKAGLGLLKKKAGLRYAMNVIPLDPTWVRGTHGRLPDTVDDSPLLLCSDPNLAFWDTAGDTVPAARVRDLVLQAAGIAVPTPDDAAYAP